MNRGARPSASPKRRRSPTDVRLLWTIASAALPSLFMLGLLLAGVDAPDGVWIALSALSAVWAFAVATAARNGVLHHVRTLTNLIEATQAQDYGTMASRAREPGELGELYGQINAFATRLKEDRQSEQELLGVLEKVVSQISVAIIVCDSRDRVRLVNLRACTLLGADAEALVGVEFAGTALAELPLSPEPQLLTHRFPGGEGRWQVVQQQYRHQGRPSRIVFITDLKQVLSEEEISAWQRLIRVISHEVNNSLTPIMSLCQTLTAILERPDSAEYAGDVRDSLGVISERAKGLKEFITAYARIARLPEPQKILFPAERLVERVKGMFERGALEIVGTTPDIELFGDPVHLEQALINLIRNALEATGTGGPPVRLHCRVRGEACEFEIVDSGAGISNPGNLFVPFYTTKPEGAGIGLVLCRQIAARHFGEVTLENRSDAHGAVARLVLPLPTRQTLS